MQNVSKTENHEKIMGKYVAILELLNGLKYIDTKQGVVCKRNVKFLVHHANNKKLNMNPSPTGRRPDLTAWGKRCLTLLTGFHISPANIQKPKESNHPWKVNDQIIAESEIINMGTSIGANESSNSYYPSNVCSEQKRDSSVWDAICNRANRDNFPLKTRRRY
ncbi:hypothetical protein BDA99DRAFT_572018 [Phascolomyces articulosus]|uniref:Uncharacterized protein n=1 Tax=Phascolomyces articulosus TaxID=60185 RepID=A0AAD5K0R7_9FUNG|nr:hypothetical protein BDA99DRAFT_572018 [Phascolomyces articulosus]